MEKIKNYRLSPEAVVMISGSSVGTQKKYYDAGFWYKQNCNGYEGTAEYLASMVLSCSNIGPFVEYEKCCINGINGCRSKNFLADAETYISLQRLYDMYRGGQLSEQMRLINTVPERINFVLEFVNDTVGIDIRESLGKILTFDMLVLNTDRHFNNLGVIINSKENKCYNAPVFDNGSSLFSSFSQFPVEKSIIQNLDRVIGQPFSANLERQAMEMGFGLKVNYEKLFIMLKKEPESRALDVLMFQLDRYKTLLRDDHIIVNVKKDSVLSKLEKNKVLISENGSKKGREISPDLTR